MTWHVHPIGAPIEQGTLYHSAEEAQAARADGQTITVQLSDYEQNVWTDRERERLSDGTYQQAPYQLAVNAPWLHFAHLSRAREGMIAFTATPQRGHLDRHEVMTPCRYLQTFCPQLDEAAREVICGEVRAAMGATLHRARTADEIERVYAAKTSWTSCMAGFYLRESTGTWVQRWTSNGVTGDRHTVSPVRAYGDSDLEVLWIGTLGATPTDDALIARAVVWPERRQYVRIYGDQLRLQGMLKADGWTQVRDFTGAQIRRIVLPDGQLSVPYVDGTSRAAVDETGHWLRLGDGHVDTSSQSGQVGDGARAICRRDYCDRDADEDGGDGLCGPCYDAQCTCVGCDETCEDSDAGTYSRGSDFYCSSCYDEHEFTCECCDRQCQPLALREPLTSEVLCERCQEAEWCDDCSSWSLDELTDDRCEDCNRTAFLEALTTAAQAARDAGATAEQITSAVVR